MQTFLPYQDFAKSASVLDNRRLGKQRSEVKTIYMAITKGNGWIHHPIVKMWNGYEKALLTYGICICTEWRNRGFLDTLLEYFENEYYAVAEEYKNPLWLGNTKFHLSHQSNLLRKKKEWYSKYFDIPDNLPYEWFKGD